MQPTVKFEKEPSVKFKTFKEAADAVSRAKRKPKEKITEEVPPYTFEDLKKLNIDELFVLSLLTQGEKVVRDKLYCALGFCQTGCKNCKKDEEC